MPLEQQNSLSRGRSFEPVGFGLSIVLLAVASLNLAAHAQEYRVDVPDANAKKHAGVAIQCVREPARFAQDQAQFEEFFNKFYFPSMTSTDPADLARLGDLRYKLFKNFLWATENEQLQKSLTDIAFSAMVRLVKTEDYHPAVRFNAILVIGMLDEQYAREGANPRPPKPLPNATKALTAVVERAPTDKGFPPPVTLGAVIGLERHAQLRDSLPPDAVQAMTAALLKLVAQNQPIQDMDHDVYAWLRLRAASALAQLGNVGPNNAVHDGLIKLAADFNSLDDRCATAALLGKIKYEGAKVDGAATAEGLFALARDIATAEAKRVKKFHDEQIGGGGAAPAQMFVPPDGSMTPQERFPRREVLARLTDLRTGLRAVKPVVPADAQTKIDALISAVDPVIVAASDKGTVELKLTGAISTMVGAIEQAIPAPDAPAAADEVASF